jgi:hypothetical protein
MLVKINGVVTIGVVARNKGSVERPTTIKSHDPRIHLLARVLFFKIPIFSTM